MRFFSFARLSVLMLAISLAACGFELRGLADLAFHNLYIQGPTLSITKPLKKSLAVNGVTIVNDPEKAELMLEMMNEGTEKRILSLSGRVGVVREFELLYKVNFRLRDPSSELWGEVQTVSGRRDFSYDDSEILAKSFEEKRLYQDMKDDAVREIMRRLIVQKPKKAADK
ncbi:MAG TPA: LPS assembly lipoprotein LptE [Methylophilaceae bacterium]|nr:LPS assembly lipoprotein LptE [Methylophilaceae bacterium]